MTATANLTSQKIGLWCNWAFCVVTLIGWIGIAHFYMPAPADLTLPEFKTWFSETYHWRNIAGCSLLYIASGFLTPGSIQWGLMLAKIEGRRPLWSITTLVCGVFISLIVFLNACAWLVCSYRQETGADVIAAFYDWAWLAFLLGWIYLAIEMLATAAVEFQDKRDTPMVPRWMTWLTVWGAFGVLGAAGPAFFKSGPFAYHGVLGFYVPATIWGLYIVFTTWFMLKELEREAREPAGRNSELLAPG
jgi:hypothetical protein